VSTIEPVDEDRRLDNCHHGSRLRLHLHLHRETEDGTFTEIVIRNRPSRYEKKCQGFSGHDIRFLVCRTGGGQTCLGSFCMPGRSGGFPPRIPYRHRSSALGPSIPSTTVCGFLCTIIQTVRAGGPVPPPSLSQPKPFDHSGLLVDRSLDTTYKQIKSSRKLALIWLSLRSIPER